MPQRILDTIDRISIYTFTLPVLWIKIEEINHSIWRNQSFEWFLQFSQLIQDTWFHPKGSQIQHHLFTSIRVSISRQSFTLLLGVSHIVKVPASLDNLIPERVSPSTLLDEFFIVVQKNLTWRYKGFSLRIHKFFNDVKWNFLQRKVKIVFFNSRRQQKPPPLRSNYCLLLLLLVLKKNRGPCTQQLCPYCLSVWN